ncbi:hypothetical protein FIU87_19125 [Bacillus sp. THAF10]|nr:hypothetical protein FIU87_19125 [Bacillus sp. THAF10]
MLTLLFLIVSKIIFFRRLPLKTNCSRLITAFSLGMTPEKLGHNAIEPNKEKGVMRMGKYSDSTFGGTGKVPLIKTGPTYGQERSRTKTGSWTK